jgi:hypothetical protein
MRASERVAEPKSTSGARYAAAPRPKRRCVEEAKARNAYVCKSDEYDSSEEGGSAESDRSEECESGESGESGESDFDEESDRSEERESDVDNNSEGDDERDGARKLKREHCKRLAECLGIGLLEMQRGARVLVALSRLGDSVSRFLDTVLYRYTGSSLRKAVRP